MKVNGRTQAAWIIGIATALVVAFLSLCAWITRFFVDSLRLPILTVAGFAAGLGVLAVLAILLKRVFRAHLIAPRRGADSMAKKTIADDVPAIRAAGVVIAMIVIVFLLFAAGAAAMNAFKFDDAVRLPLLVIGGLVSLIALLAVMAIAFKTVHLANQTQALGLPDGTVRAVIALSLILIFAVVTVYLFSELSGPDKTLNANQPAMSTDTTVTTSTATTSTALSPTDTRRASKLAASQDFAKQLLIMLGTLITSITSFYFGSKTDAPTNRPAAPTPPKLTGVDKPRFSSDNDTNVTAQGSGLQPAQHVTLRNSAQGEHGTIGFSSTDTAVRFTVTKRTPPGTWDVVVKMNDGSEATLPAAITIT